MGLREQLAEYQRSFEAVLAVATCHESVDFLDLQWPPFDVHAYLKRVLSHRDPGVIFETCSRVVVIEEHSGEVRYYAGGWRSDESRIHLEQERIEAEGFEMGVFRTPRDGVLFTERFLVGKQSLQDIEAGREVRHRRETSKKLTEPS